MWHITKPLVNSSNKSSRDIFANDYILTVIILIKADNWKLKFLYSYSIFQFWFSLPCGVSPLLVAPLHVKQLTVQSLLKWNAVKCETTLHKLAFTVSCIHMHMNGTQWNEKYSVTKALGCDIMWVLNLMPLTPKYPLAPLSSLQKALH